MMRDDTEIIQSIWSVNYKETKRQKEYRIGKAQSKYWCVILCLLIADIEQLCLVILEIVAVANGAAPAGLICRVLSFAILLTISISYHKFYQNRYFGFILLIGISSILISSIISLSRWPIAILLLEVSLTILLLNHTILFSLSTLIFLNLSLLTSWFVSVYFLSSLSPTSILLLIFFTAINLFGTYRGEDKFCKSYNLQIQSDKEIRETENLLVQMMPAHVVRSLSEGTPITEKLNDITLLFADIVGFTAWSAGKSPQQVVQMLSNLFTEFDKQCVELGIYKVHTIGDCYVVMGYLAGKRDPIAECGKVVRMAKNMIRIIDQENLMYGMTLAMRVGVHTGEVIAGVIGNKVVRYDIWGSDVLIANKMESGGQSGEINVSETTKKILEESYPGLCQFKFNKEIGKNPTYGSYFVSGEFLETENF